MNIVFSINVPYPEGMAGSMRVKLFAEYLAEKGHPTSVLITNRDNGQNESSGIERNVKYRNLFLTRLPYLVHLLLYPFQSFIFFATSKKKNTKNILIIYGDIDFLTLPIIVTARFFGFKVVIDIVEDRSLQSEELSLKAKLNLRLSEFIMPLTIKSVHGIIVISSYLKNKFELIDNKIPITLIPVSAANLLSLVPHERIKKSKTTHLVYSGSFGVKDGIQFLIDAFNKVSNKYPSLRLTLIGTANEDIYKLTSSNKNITVTGYLVDFEYWKILYSADILCMTRINSPFANAGFPFKLGEYLAAEKVVIATNVSDVGLYLENKKDALLIEPSNSLAIGDAIDYYFENIDRMPNLARNGFHKSKQFFNPLINSKILERFVEQI